jgi:ferredoxin
MAAAIRGDIAAVADISFDCIACGLCVARCPSEQVPPNIALLARRLYGKYLAPHAEHLRRRIAEIEGGSFRPELAQLKSLPVEELKKRYAARQIEE